MKLYTGQAPPGFYYDPAEWRPLTLSVGQSLPAPCYRLPLPILLILAPAMGGLFAIFLPAIGFVALGRALLHIVQKCGRVVLRKAA